MRDTGISKVEGAVERLSCLSVMTSKMYIKPCSAKLSLRFLSLSAKPLQLLIFSFHFWPIWLLPLDRGGLRN